MIGAFLDFDDCEHFSHVHALLGVVVFLASKTSHNPTNQLNKPDVNRVMFAIKLCHRRSKMLHGLEQHEANELIKENDIRRRSHCSSSRRASLLENNRCSWIRREKNNHQARVVQKMNSAIHRINHCPADKYLGNQLRYPVDRDLSGG